MEGLVIGLDLNDDYSQISCNEKEKSWTVPTVICRRKEKETWLIGEEAYAATLLGEGVIVDKLLKMVRKEGTSTIGGICYTGTDLLKIFLKKLLRNRRKSNRLPDVLCRLSEHSQGPCPCDQSYRKFCLLCAQSAQRAVE